MDIDEKWEEAIVSLTLAARTNAGVSQDRIDQALQCTIELCHKYKGKRGIPMKIVNTLIDMQSSLITCGDRHLNELNNKDQARKIYGVATNLSSIAREMTT
ncbi:hypothetical protein JYG36_12205 [Pseudomonas sp. SORT22]|uniref:hypothetical protein n=1 Tax=Pseudomonas sp. SORT22 TaxID=2813842 RepID=UPI001BD155F9|nr:hypothetical protein [Pseudomonas sp. SORT22]QVM98883.1 hypothetical protein JYG36_12205 [Pseudomonas sp. SORT22]